MLKQGPKAACPQCPLNIGCFEVEIANHKRQYPSHMWDSVATQNVLSNRSAYPLVACIAIGSKCNSACRMCYRVKQAGQPDTIMPDATVDKLKGLLDQTPHIEYSGGDLFALTDEQIDKFLSINDAANHTAITNGLGLTLDRIDKYVKTGALTGLKISLETTDSLAYTEHCGRAPGDLYDRLIALNGQNVIWYSTVVTVWTLPYLPEFVDFAAKTNVKDVNIKPYVGDALECMGFGGANVFGSGWQPVIHDFAVNMFAEAEERAKRSGVTICGLDLCRKALDRAKKERGGKFK